MENQNVVSCTMTLNESHKESAKKLGKHGWLIPMDLPIYKPTEICDDSDSIDEIMFGYYSNDIRFTDMVGELIAAKIAKKHRGVILQSYCAYKMNLFSLCISSLNPLYEGFLSELIDNKNVTSQKAMIKEIKDKYFVKSNSLVNQSLELIYLNLEVFFDEYTKNMPFSKLQNGYSRHNLAHGRVYINDDQLQVIKMFSNLYNIAVFFSGCIEEISGR